MECSKNDQCSIAIIDSSICNIYIKVELKDLITIHSPTSTIYVKDQEILFKKINRYLMHHWPFNNNYDDIIGGANLIGTSSASFTTDRLNKISKAVYLNNGFLQAPNGVYFKGDFTISAWVKPLSIVHDHRVLDFGPKDIDGISFAYAGPYAYVCSNINCKLIGSPLPSPFSLRTNEWQHLGLSLSGSTGYLYINGKLVNTSPDIPTPRAVFREGCYFGKSNYQGQQSVDAVFDDIKIFNKSFNQEEINLFMNL
jgi:hypothetical protein